MSQEQNKTIVRAYVDAFNRGDFDAIVPLCTPDVTIQGVLGKGGWDIVLPTWRDLHHAFDIRLQVEALIAEGDFVAARYVETGTFRNTFRGKSATGKTYSVVAMEWFRIKDGKIAERWGARDSANIFRQIGLE